MSEQPQQRSTEGVEVAEEDILTASETVIDLGLDINIVNLGLIYGAEFTEEISDTIIKMTLTTMGYLLAGVLTEQVHSVLRDISEVNNIEVKLVWYPAQTTGKVSCYARTTLGIRQLFRG